MNIGFIGAGGVAQVHMRNLSKMRAINITAVCDLNTKLAAEIADKYGAASFGDYRTMLKRGSLDACYVCVIPCAHGRIELDLVKAKIPFYAEKPIHLDLRACQKVIDALAASDVINSVGYHWRYGKGAQRVKKFIDKKEHLSLVEGYWYDSMPSQVLWWREMAKSGGQLVEQATHVVDLARYLAGEIHTVYATASTGAMTEFDNYDVYDVTLASLSFDSGAVGTITVGCIADGTGGSKMDITVKGRGWRAVTNSDNGEVSDANGVKHIEGGQAWAEQLGNGDRRFIQAVRSNDQSKILSDYISGAQTLAVTLAGNRSITTGRAVKVRRFL